MSVLFVTGTDTDAGKTYVTTELIRRFCGRGLTVRAFKPIATGCTHDNGSFTQGDVTALQTALPYKSNFHDMCFFSYEPPIAPHIAAEIQHERLSSCLLDRELSPRLERNSIHIIEGAGGWHVPLNDTECISDWVVMHKWPVLLVVGMRVGCLNHALLTCEAMQNQGADIIGWVANCVDPTMTHVEENILYLQKKIKSAYLGQIAYQKNADDQMIDRILSYID